MEVVNLTAGEGRAVAARIEGLWSELLQVAAPSVAMFTTLHQRDQEAAVRLFGADTMQQGAALLAELHTLWRAAQELRSGSAVLIAWREGPEGMSVAVVRRAGIPAGGQLAAWPIVVGIGLVAIAAGFVLVRSFDLDIQKLKNAAAALRIQAVERATQNAAAIRATDPAFAQRMLDAVAAATAAEVQASSNPGSWLDRFFAGFGAIGQAIPPLALLLGLLWLAGRRPERRRAAA